ncbi:MAG: hypothetical protein QM715_20920 [Nibricoccus sp.]
MSKSAANVTPRSEVSASGDALLARLRAMKAQDRLAAIANTLEAIQSSPTTENVFLRKTLLRLQDTTRLEIGEVAETDLHRENSPFARMDFRRAHLTFRKRAHA